MGGSITFGGSITPPRVFEPPPTHPPPAPRPAVALAIRPAAVRAARAARRRSFCHKLCMRPTPSQVWIWATSFDALEESRHDPAISGGTSPSAGPPVPPESEHPRPPRRPCHVTSRTWGTRRPRCPHPFPPSQSPQENCRAGLTLRAPAAADATAGELRPPLSTPSGHRVRRRDAVTVRGCIASLRRGSYSRTYSTSGRRRGRGGAPTVRRRTGV